MLRSRSYVMLLVFAAVLGVPIAAAALAFLQLVSHMQTWVFTDLPSGLGFDTVPTWWPIVPLVVAGFLVGAIIRYLPGRGGHSPADGFHAGAPPAPIELPGVLFAALVSLGLGAVIGPEAPLIALGGGLAALIVRSLKRDAPAQAILVIGGAGSFAAVSALLGSPLLGAFLLMEALGLGGATATLMLLPGLLAAGVGALVFLGFDAANGVGTISLAVPNLPPFAHPNGAQFLWALAIGVAAAFVGSGIRVLALWLRPYVERRMVLLTPVAGLGIALLAILYGEATDKNPTEVLFSGQSALPTLINQHASYAIGGAAAADGVQVARLRHLVEQLPWRSGVPGDVHRWCRGRGDGRTAGDEPHPGRGHGHRGDECGDVAPALDLSPAGHAAPRRGRFGSDARRDRRSRGLVRGLRLAAAGPSEGRRWRGGRGTRGFRRGARSTGRCA